MKQKVLSKLQSDNNAMKKMTLSLSYITFPLMMILVLVAEPLIILLYGEKWLPCVPYFQILSIGGIVICIYNIHYFTVAAKGESKKLFYRTIIKRGLGIAILIVCFYYFGIAGLLCGCAATSWIILFVNMYLVSKSIKYKFSSQLKDLFPVTFLSIVCFIFSYMVTHTIDFNIYIKGILALILYILLYAMFLFFF